VLEQRSSLFASSSAVASASGQRTCTTPLSTQHSGSTHGNMPSSASSSSSVYIIGDSSARRPADTDDDGTSGGDALTRPVAERLASSFRTQESLDALCKKRRVPEEFAPLPAGDRRACSPPPPGAVCVYAHSLEAGMRVPLHPLFGEVLSHFGAAPSQLAPNGWRAMAGFVVICHFAGVGTPSLAVFRHFFSLSAFKLKGWYSFQGKDAAGLLSPGSRIATRGGRRGSSSSSPRRRGRAPSSGATRPRARRRSPCSPKRRGVWWRSCCALMAG
jgi:hypothetical protein